MKYDVIIFDADDTLFDFKKSEEEAFKDTMKEFEITSNDELYFDTYKTINKAIWKEFEQGLITQERLKIERFKRFLDTLEGEYEAESFAKSYMKHLSYASYLYEDSANLVEELYNNYKLSIITNGLTDVQNNRIRKSIIAKYFDDIVISEEVGVSKPNPEIFKIALDNIKYENKEKILMVGDSLTSDVQGGINFGIDTCWCNFKKEANSTGINPTYEITSLKQLSSIINN